MQQGSPAPGINLSRFDLSERMRDAVATLLSDEIEEFVAELVRNSRLGIALAFQEKLANLRRAEARSPVDWQEGKHATEYTQVEIGRKVDERGRVTKITREGARRRMVDARLWERMSGDQQQAAEDIARAFAALVSGLMTKNMAYERIDPGRRDPWEQWWERIEALWQWDTAARREGIDVDAVLDVLVYGYSCRQVDANRRRRRHWARANLFEGLDCYCEVRGWRKIRE